MSAEAETEFEVTGNAAELFLTLPERLIALLKDFEQLKVDMGTLRFEIAKERDERDRLRRQIVGLRVEVDAMKERGQ